MTVKQINEQFEKAKEAEREGKMTQVARHIATARKQDDSIGTLEVAEGMDWSKGQARDFLGQRRYVEAEPFEVKKAAPKKTVSKSSSSKSSSSSSQSKSSGKSKS